MSHEEIENLLEAAWQLRGLVEGSERGKLAYLRALGVVLTAGAWKEKAVAVALKRAGIELQI
jgi:glycerol-3-phosphate dehydrogenase